MTAQEILQRVRKHFVEDKNPPGMEGGSCKYTMGCAMGIFMSKEMQVMLDGDPESSGIKDAMRCYPEVLALFSGIDDGFLQSVQTAHDMASDAWQENEEGEGESFAVALARRLNQIESDYDLKEQETDF